ncbi:peroxidase [Vigna unguiculata]|uniref:peroxidase n=1 Tax=Vigna unguiculata TaxID=3917 RepID=A0A4D6NDT0_VIGUN|nr:peroxidase [Vigna unguiculata]
MNTSNIVVRFFLLFSLIGIVSAQLSATFYAKTCPNALSTIKTEVVSAVNNDRRMGASLLRLHFHDCFGCDASVLLDDTSSFTGEKTAGPNANSLRGFDVIDTIKSKVESLCPGVVSCADILTVAARDSVVALGGASWTVPLGRRDSTTASLSSANSDLPGSHTIGQARCVTFRRRIYNDTNIDSSFATSLQANCPSTGGDSTLSPLDTTTPNTFDNAYFKNLQSKKGLLHSDQELFNGGSTDSQVNAYSTNPAAFKTDFANAMVKMGNLSPLTGSKFPFTIMDTTLFSMNKPTTLKIRFFLFLCFFIGIVSSQLSSDFYSTTCPNALSTIKSGVDSAVSNEARMGASLLRLHFHDCFGCDASVLLNDTSSFTGEQSAGPNVNSIRGFGVIDSIKSELESLCPGVVSCADILAVAARDSVVALGGQSWTVQLGRRDSTTASFSGANSDLPGFSFSLQQLIDAFSKKDFTTEEMVTLSGGHTIGQASCSTFRTRIYNDTNIDSSFATSLQANCPSVGGDRNLAPLDTSPTTFDNAYFQDLQSQKGLLHSDQELFNGGSTDSQVNGYVSNPSSFQTDFANAMVKMGNLSPLTGSSGEIRTNCWKTN